jgi:hypothetical protein
MQAFCRVWTAVVTPHHLDNPVRCHYDYIIKLYFIIVLMKYLLVNSSFLKKKLE